MDLFRQERIYTFYLYFISTIGLFVLTTAVTSNSACFGNAATNATTLNLQCQDGTISITNVTVGAKATTLGCPSSFTDTMTQDIACCSPSTNTADDCTFAVVDTTDYEQACNGQESCEPEAKNEVTTGHCDMTFPATTIFMFIDYQCITKENSGFEKRRSDHVIVILAAVLVLVWTQRGYLHHM